MKIRPFALAFVLLVLIPAVALAIQIQRAQLGITIIVNVTPNPLGYLHRHDQGALKPLIATATLRGASPKIQRYFEAEELHFVSGDDSQMVAQVQHSTRVEAEITPNPTATLLTTNAPGTTVTVSAEAGVVAVVSCAYNVKVDTTVASWTLKHGLSNDFSSGTASWSGTDLSNNSYSATPRPTSTPFAVYADDGNAWNVLATSGGTQTYCVDLTLNIPIATPQGTYSSNAIYTLYY